MKPNLLSWLAILLLFPSTVTFADPGRDQLFDANWKFLRADAAGAERPEFDDATWRVLDVPHDWSIEDLPTGGPSLPVISVVPGKWRFHKGDDAAWKTPACNDSDWQEVTLPAYWEQHSNYTEENVYGWFRRRLELPANCQGKEVELLLGRIDDVDEAWLNGVRIGGTGSFPPNYRTAYDAERRYRVPAGVVHGDGTDVLAVRVFDGSGNGGIYAAGTAGQRVGPFDPSASPGGASTGHVLGGTGWYRKYFTLHPSDKGKSVTIRFDGVYMDADVWLNGHPLGNHPYGYTSFAYDLTPHLKPAGQPNVLAVRVRNEGKNSRWYSGAGIFRHVWLTVTDPVRVPTWGLYVTALEVSRKAATVKVFTEIENGRDVAATVTVRTRLLDSWG
ncbi:MAG TPA: beta galactosidase jelly roll domain-containing protein, partial [Candidatus Sulfotelmatobacter sp.]|nr:beta galactosidase jelly roll domain-containing protein [Candidatus Sulfotelmatobacter sp.]